MGRKTTDYTDFTDFIGLEFFSICNFGEVANRTYFIPWNLWNLWLI